MHTAVEYSENIDKEAGAINAIGKGVASLFGRKAGAVARLGARKVKNAPAAYKGTNAHKNYGNKPLYAIGGAAAFGAGNAMGSPSKGQGVQINLPGSRQVRI